MRFIFLSLILLCLSPLILNAESCKIDSTNDKNITSFDDCKGYSVSSDSKLCCYVSGQDEKNNDISACQELTGTEKGIAKDLYDLQELSFTTEYYLQADCNLGKKISICDPDATKSDTPLSTNICKNYLNVGITGINEDMKCCYLTGKNVQNKDVYACVGTDDYFYTIDDRKSEIESGKFKRLGALKDIKIVCNSSSFISSFLSLLVALYSLLL